jgi:hypothetical protein
MTTCKAKNWGFFLHELLTFCAGSVVGHWFAKTKDIRFPDTRWFLFVCFPFEANRRAGIITTR